MPTWARSQRSKRTLLHNGTSGGPAVTSSSVCAFNMSSVAIGLPKFDGEGSLNRFVEDFSIYASLQGWDDERKRTIVPLCLTGIARDAYDAIPESGRGTFNDVVAGLRKSFGAPSSLEKHLTLQNLKYDPKEPLDTFVIKLKKQVSGAFPGQALDGILLNHFLTALPTEYRSAVIAAGVSSFEDAVQKVRNVKSASAAAGCDNVAPVHQLDRSDSDLIQQLQRRISELESRLAASSPGTSAGTVAPAPEPRSGHSRSGCPPQSDRRVVSPRVCWACGESGHFIRVCPQRNSVCSGCGKRGHQQSMCQEKCQGN